MTRYVEYMDISGIRRTVHATNEWLAQMASELETSDKQVVYPALRGVLSALRDPCGLMK